MRIHNAVMCYSSSQECIDRYISLWKQFDNQIFFYSSEDSFPLNTYGYPIFKAGQSGHRGAHTIKRHLLFFEEMLKYDAQWFVINDYDSFILCSPHEFIADRDPCIFGNVIETIGANKHTIEKYQGKWPKFFIHPPYIIHKKVLTSICNAAIPFNVQHGYFDRWLGLVCEYTQPLLVSFTELKGLNGIESLNVGYSENTVRKSTLLREGLDKIRKYKVFHGIKKDEVFELVVTKKDLP